MEYFLQRIARHLYTTLGNNLHNHCLVFPNRRAGLFLNKYLAGEINKPVWAPAVLTINDLFHSWSGLQPAGNEILLFELYKIYIRIRKSKESFDDFYFWGDMLLNDFDDVDKYLADASKVFRNVLDLKKIDEEFGTLTDEQVETIRRFWMNFNPAKLTKEKSEFINIWSILNDLYNEFRNTLNDKKIGYEGMIFREVVENHLHEISAGLKWEKLHFIGFNALNRCEDSLMMSLKKANRACFYWDYDNSYISPGKLNSAGFFLKDNLLRFGNDMPADWSYDTFLSGQQTRIKRQVISVSSDVAQVKLLPGLIEKLDGLTSVNAHQTAVILADENLLIPVLSSLPSYPEDINITMGYPLKYTREYSFVKRLLEMQRKARTEGNTVLFEHEDIERIITDDLISGLLNDQDKQISQKIISGNLFRVPSDLFSGSEFLSKIFSLPGSPAQLSDYLKDILIRIISGIDEEGERSGNDSALTRLRNEFIYRILLSLNRLDGVASSPEIKITVSTWTRILERLLNEQSVPFSGEPLSGIQVMGILESRALDFRNIIMLSVNEGVLPSLTSSSSFIPFSLREAFGLPSINHQESVFAYHFFRLLHRAENVTFLYNSNSEGLKSGEISRFLLQMKYLDSDKPVMQDLSFRIRKQNPVPEVVERKDEHNKRLVERFSGKVNGRDRYISPSAINTWLNCRMKFYYRYVCGLEEKKKIQEEIDPATLGSILHSAIKTLYEKYRSKVLNGSEINSLLNNRNDLADLIRHTIRETTGGGNNQVFVGNEMIVRDVLMVFLSRVLLYDRDFAPLTILAFEEPFGFPVNIKTSEGNIILKAGGNIDRVDNKNGVTRIIDYKTGNVADSINSIGQLFMDDRDKDPDGWLQTLLYCESYLSVNQGVKAFPAIYKLRKNPGKDLSEKLLIKPDFIVDDYNSVRDEFLEFLDITLGRIFSSEEPFVMTGKSWGKCSYCPFRGLCQR